MEWLYSSGIGTIVISSGEFNNEGRTEFIETIIQNTMEKSRKLDQDLRVIVSLASHLQRSSGDTSGGAAIQVGFQMGEVHFNTAKRYRDKGASLVYMRMEAMDRLLDKDVCIRERGYDERVE